MFVTLSRRNTTLVNQQLALIESLEQDEEDPQRLEQLFSLDHLATRMRRTAESLVILGGTTGRTASFEELSVSDVIHAAVSEVQDYQRVRIDAAPDQMISGRAAADVVHLMAELIDNALSYSPPGSPVTIQAAEEDGRVEIEVIDSGLGMAGDALARANESLKSGGEVTIDTARRMGLFVVSRLAEEHGLKVKLRRNVNGGGIIASITLPADVLATDEPVEHVSILDAPEQVEAPAPVVEDEPDEEYDPYLERIEEAIAAVTGLPRRRPGFVGHEPEPVADARGRGQHVRGARERGLDAAMEPIALPGMHDDTETLAPERPGRRSRSRCRPPSARRRRRSPRWSARTSGPTVTTRRPTRRTTSTRRRRRSRSRAYEPSRSRRADEPQTEVEARRRRRGAGRSPTPEPSAEPELEETAAEQRSTPRDPGRGATPTTRPPTTRPPTSRVRPRSRSRSRPRRHPSERDRARRTPGTGGLAETPEPTDAPAPAVSDMPVRLKIRRPLSASAAASALDGGPRPRPSTDRSRRRSSASCAPTG